MQMVIIEVLAKSRKPNFFHLRIAIADTKLRSPTSAMTPYTKVENKGI